MLLTVELTNVIKCKSNSIGLFYVVNRFGAWLLKSVSDHTTTLNCSKCWCKLLHRKIWSSICFGDASWYGILDALCMCYLSLSVKYMIICHFGILVIGPKWANALFLQKNQCFAPFSKLIREMLLFWNLIFSKSSFNLKLNFWTIEL